ncbi:MAG: hypothetical protein U0359_32360 [Byssovorax sp.]
MIRSLVPALTLALIGCAPSAVRTTSPAAAHQDLVGPYPSIEAYCASRPADPRPDDALSACGRGTPLNPPEARAAGPIRAAVLVERRSADEGTIDALAIQTDQGWFVDETDGYLVQYDGPYRMHLIVDDLRIEAPGRVHLGARVHAYTSATAETTGMEPSAIDCHLVAGRPRCARAGE